MHRRAERWPTRQLRSLKARTTWPSLAAHVSIILTCVKALPYGLGDEQRLTQVLLNLVGNAIKFTDSGEVRIAAGAANGHFTVSVSDTGPGIPAEECERIFEKFRQVDSSMLLLFFIALTEQGPMRGSRDCSDHRRRSCTPGRKTSPVSAPITTIPIHSSLLRI
jgi:hypothetical protein